MNFRTRFGDFRLSRQNYVGVSIWRATRDVGYNGKWIHPGELFAVTHTKLNMLSAYHPPRIYGRIMAMFDKNGIEIQLASEPEPEEPLMIRRGKSLEWRADDWMNTHQNKSLADAVIAGYRMCQYDMRKNEKEVCPKCGQVETKKHIKNCNFVRRAK